MVALLMGCAPADEPDAPSPETLPVTQARQPGARVVACSPRAWTGLVGKPVGQARLNPGLTYRVMQRGALITDDYDHDRLNIVTDPSGNVLAVSCG